MAFEERFDLLVESGQANEQSVAATKKALQMVERHYGIRVTEELGASLVNHMATTLKRLMEGKTLTGLPDSAWEELSHFPEECALAASIVSEVERALNLSVDHDEMGFIAVHLCKIRIESQPKGGA